MTVATRQRPIQVADVKSSLNSRVRLVVMANEQLDIDQVLVGDLVGLARRVDGKQAYEAIVIDVLGRMYAVALRRIRSIDSWAPQLPPTYHLIRNPNAPDPDVVVQLTKRGGHLDSRCHRCAATLPDARAHTADLECRQAASDTANL
jgi:hypothetical protein